MTTVSAIIPAFNAAATIRACVESVRRQRYPGVEVIVVDDGSWDETAEIAREIPGVILLRQENAGPASARNRGIERASGRWLAFLDSDDEWIDDEKIGKQLACARNHDAVLIGTSRRRGIEREVPLRRLLLGNPFATSTVLAEKDSVVKAGCFEKGRYYSEDYLLWLTIVASGGKAVLADLPRSRNIAGRKNFARGGLSGDLLKMQRGEECNFRSLFRKRLLATSAAGNALWYLIAMTVSRIKFLRRLFLRAVRGMRGQG